jgi:cobyrinic acid a,c-diamide synthase
MQQPTVKAATTPRGESPSLALADDEAFHFYYPDNLEALERDGCELVRFSPLHDSSLPPDVQGVYFGGGYPEEYAAELAANIPLLDSIRTFAAAGGLIYAECGGLMYVSEWLETLDGERHRMLGLMPATTRMSQRMQTLGYREATLAQDNFWGKRGDKIRGHEFHYSELVRRPDWPSVYQVTGVYSHESASEGFQRHNVVASYLHLHFASRPKAVAHFVESLRQARRQPLLATGSLGRKS